MTSPERRRRVMPAAQETANLIVLTIALVASGLTLDWRLLAGCALAEALYLTAAARSSRYQARIAARELSAAQPIAFIDQLLLSVTVAGFVVIFFFGLGKHLLSRLLPDLSHAQGWEVGAISWTSLFLIYYLAKFRSGNGKGEPANDGVHNFILLMLALTYIGLLIGAWYTKAKPLGHVAFIWGIGACFCLVDWMSMKRADSEERKKRAQASLRWADYPMVAALSVLIVYLYLHRDAENPEVFVAGVVSCQLIMSNAVFVVMEFGLLGPPQPEGRTAGAPAVQEPPAA